MGVLAGIGASPGSLAGEHAPEAASSAAAATWRGQVDVHVAQRVPRSRFVEQLEQEPDLDAIGATSAESSAAADALAAAARQAVHLHLSHSPSAEKLPFVNFCVCVAFGPCHSAHFSVTHIACLLDPFTISLIEVS